MRQSLAEPQNASPAAPMGNFEDDDIEKESLLTEKSLQLSLSAPRFAPYGTAPRTVLLSADPSADPYVDHQNDNAHSDYNVHSGIRERIMHLIYNTSLGDNLPHPHLIESSDNTTRFLGSVLPLKWQNHVRDSGGFRYISDNLVKLSFPVGAVANPRAAKVFLQLTNQLHTLRYGSNHESQFIDMFFPRNVPRNQLKGMLFFVHGGAWGSGKPWIYRLAARPFLKQKFAVAIVGYRVYPDGDVNVQIRDLESAHDKLSKEYPDLCGPSRKRELIVMGHSSGAHIALMMIVEQVKRTVMAHDEGMIHHSTRVVDKFVGISGPYNVSHHFDYEAARGVEELSPLKPACRYSREQFRKHSPALILQDFLATTRDSMEHTASMFFPNTLLAHGMEDAVVPFTATSEAAHVLRSCGIWQLEEFYAPRTKHQDTVVQLMLGGIVERAVVRWLAKSAVSTELPLRSNL